MRAVPQYWYKGTVERVLTDQGSYTRRFRMLYYEDVSGLKSVVDIREVDFSNVPHLTNTQSTILRRCVRALTGFRDNVTAPEFFVDAPWSFDPGRAVKINSQVIKAIAQWNSPHG